MDGIGESGPIDLAIVGLTLEGIFPWREDWIWCVGNYRPIYLYNLDWQLRHPKMVRSNRGINREGSSPDRENNQPGVGYE